MVKQAGKIIHARGEFTEALLQGLDIEGRVFDRTIGLGKILVLVVEIGRVLKGEIEVTHGLVVAVELVAAEQRHVGCVVGVGIFLYA